MKLFKRSYSFSIIINILDYFSFPYSLLKKRDEEKY